MWSDHSCVKMIGLILFHRTVTLVMIKLYTILFLLFPFLIKSQCSYTGLVLDEEGRAIEFASIGIFHKEELIHGEISDENGKFSMSLPCGNYEISIKFLGYEEISTSVIFSPTISDEQQFVLRKQTEVLSEIEITSKRFERRSDRLTFYPSIKDGIGKTTMDLFRVIPGVWIDALQRISINGKGGTRFMVNGKLINLGGEQLLNYLQTIPATSISKIVLIHSPGAEYDASSSGGIIDIRLKRNLVDGLKSNLFAGYEKGRRGEYSAGIFSSFNKKKFSVTTNFYLLNRLGFMDVIDERSSETIEISSLSANTNTLSDVKSNQIRLGTDYQLSSQSNINIEWVRTFTNRDEDSSGSSISDQQSDINSILSDYDYNMEIVYNSIALQYDNTIDSLGSSLKMVAEYINNENNRNGLYNSDYLRSDNSLLFNNTVRTTLPQQSDLFNARLDLNLVLPNQKYFGIGSKYSTNSISNDLITELFLDSSFQIDSGNTNQFLFDENVFAAYVYYAASFNSGHNFNIGLRTEHTKLEGKSSSTTPLDQSFLDFFPSLSYAYIFGKNQNQSLSFNYGRKIQRPSFDALNSFEYVVSEFTRYRGNSTLRPEYSNSYKLNWTNNVQSFDIFYHSSSNVINQVSLFKDNLVINTSANLANNYIYGASFNTPLISKEKSVIRLSSALYNTRYKSNLITDSQLTYQFNLNTSQTLPKGFILRSDFSYTSKNLSGNLIYKPAYSVNISLQKSINSWTARLAMTDVFDTLKYTSNLAGSDDIQYINIVKNQTQKVQLFIFYNFQTGKSFNKKNIDRDAIDANRLEG